jgi:hypothetical protein
MHGSALSALTVSRWYRAYEGTVTDAKLGEAAMIADVSRSVAIAAWHCLLESAACKNNCGSYETTPRRVAVILCEPGDKIEALFEAFSELNMIGDGAVASWKKRQFQSDDSKERVRRHREKKRQETTDVTACNGDVTPPYTETETETEEGGSNEPPSARVLWSKPPVDVEKQTWTDFKANRRQKKLGFTASTYNHVSKELQRVSVLTGIPPPTLLEHAAAAGWGGIYDPNERKQHGRSNRPSPLDQLVAASFGAGARTGENPQAGSSGVDGRGGAVVVARISDRRA